MDTIGQEFDEASGKLRLERVLGVRQGAPRWAVKVSRPAWKTARAGSPPRARQAETEAFASPIPPSQLLNLSEDTYVREVSIFDPASSRLEMTSTNMSLAELLLVREYITYTKPSLPEGASPDPSSSAAAPAAASTPTSDATIFSQTANIRCGGALASGGLLGKAGKKLENSSFDRFGSNAVKGKEGLMAVLKNLWGEPRQGGTEALMENGNTGDRIGGAA